MLYNKILRSHVVNFDLYHLPCIVWNSYFILSVKTSSRTMETGRMIKRGLSPYKLFRYFLIYVVVLKWCSNWLLFVVFTFCLYLNTISLLLKSTNTLQTHCSIDVFYKVILWSYTFTRRLTNIFRLLILSQLFLMGFHITLTQPYPVECHPVSKALRAPTL